MKIESLIYFVIDAICMAGIFLSFFYISDKSFVPLFIGVLLMTVMHQVYDEKKYFLGMFDQGRTNAIRGWILWRWILTLCALVAFVGVLIS